MRTILEGSVRRAGNRIRVTAQLINAADGYHLWSERYDRELTDVFAVQDEIAAAIAGALQVKLTGKPATTPHEPNLPAYEAFLKARHQFLKRSLRGTRSAHRRVLQAGDCIGPAVGRPSFCLGRFILYPRSRWFAPAE